MQVMEYSADRSALKMKTAKDVAYTLSQTQEQALSKAYSYLGFYSAAAGHNNSLNFQDLKNAIRAIMDVEPADTFIQMLLTRFSTNKEYISLPDFRKLMLSGILFPEYKGRYYTALSLAEAETVRRILHVRRKKYPNQIIPNQTTELALRYSYINSTGNSEGGLLFDSSPGWKESTTATPFEASVAYHSFRFFDCDMHYPVQGLNVLIRAIKSSLRDRERFFTSTIGCRRRMERKVC